MPKYRQLHVKIVDSFDFSEMPDDFVRVFWLLLIVIADSEGRAIDNPAWLRSKMFPLREDVNAKQINNALDWLDKRGMVLRYHVDGKGYFCIPKFQQYQSGTSKEAKSVLPPPPSEGSDNSVPTPEQVRSGYAPIQYNTNTNTKAKQEQPRAPSSNFTALQDTYIELTGQTYPSNPKSWIDALKAMDEASILPIDLRTAYEWKKEKHYAVKSPGSLHNSANYARMLRTGENGKPRDKRDIPPPIFDPDTDETEAEKYAREFAEGKIT